MLYHCINFGGAKSYYATTVYVHTNGIATPNESEGKSDVAWLGFYYFTFTATQTIIDLRSSLHNSTSFDI